MVTSAKGGSNPQMAKAPPKGIKPPDKRKKNVAKTSASAVNLANPSANLRSKLQDKVKHMAVLVARNNRRTAGNRRGIFE